MVKSPSGGREKWKAVALSGSAKGPAFLMHPLTPGVLTAEAQACGLLPGLIQ